MSEPLPDIGVPHYRMLSRLGRGGMGEVWLAQDTRLGRKVAIKLLPSAGTQDREAVLRFVQEARAASALNHPHIVTVHDFGESSAGHFIVMELVGGATLRSVLARERTAASLLDWFAQMARGVAAAHAAGITHRDLKPENVMLRDDGYIKLLDFGLARLMHDDTSDDAATATQHTTPGQVMGTLRYMSPEQLRGERAGPPSDIYSLGLVFFELASGRCPAREEKASTDSLTLLPAAVRELIQRMLAIKAADRPTAADVVKTLESSTAPTPSVAAPVNGFGGRPAIAVLPFENLSSDAEQQFFIDGLVDELITRLSLWRSFPVIARNSSFAFRGKTSDPKLIAETLGARYLVQGSVRKGGPRVRIAAQLVVASSGQQVWAKSFDRELFDVFAVQDEISEAIAASIVSDLHRVESANVQRRPPESLEAWELYQRALPLIESFRRDDAIEGRRLLERSVALDPTFASPLARLAQLSIWDAVFNWTENPEEGLMVGLEQARRAVALDAMDSDAHAFLGWMLMTVGRIGEGAAALEASRRAVELNPSSIWALMIHAWVCCMTGGDAEMSILEVERAMRLSPHDPAEFIFYDIGSAAHLTAGRYESGLALARRLTVVSPNYYWGYLWCAANAAGAGNLDEARGFVEEARRIQPDVSIALVRQSLGAMGPGVDRMLAELLGRAGLGD